MKIAVQGQAADVEVISELLSPWDVSFTSLDEAEVVIVYKKKPLVTKKTLVIPSNSAEFIKWAKSIKSKILKKRGDPVFVAASSQMFLTIMPEVLYCYDGLVKSYCEDNSSIATELNENLFVLTLDVVEEYHRILGETLNVRTSSLFRLITGLPVAYTLAPKRLRNLLLQNKVEKENVTFSDKLSLDALRFILVRTIEKLLNKNVQRKLWNGKKYALIVTHDVDTREGLLKAKHLKKLEKKYHVSSAWYIPSKRYKLDTEIVRELANHDEVGAHGTSHDGKLIHLPQQKLLERMKECKETLAKVAGVEIHGFRTPLLQCSKEIINSTIKTGFRYDSSCPTWEPLSPTTLKPYGIRTSFPIMINNMVEIPVTFLQDHQLLYLLKKKPEQCTQIWIELKEHIKEIGGLCSLLIHPDYEFTKPKNLIFYEQFLNIFTEDSECLITTPNELVQLWKFNLQDFKKLE